MKKLYILLIVALSSSLISLAQNDVRAKKILDGVSAKVKTFKGITANFSIKSITSKGRSNGIKTGYIVIKGQKYLLKQGKTEIKCDGIKTYNFDGSKTITVTPVEENNQTLTPQNLLSNFYDKDFTYKLVSSDGQFNEIELLPVDKRKNFQKVNIYIDKVKDMITKARILDKSNNVLEFSLSNLITNATVADNNFIFDRNKYPKDAEVLD
jgi:outer membrane lipoprotein carrier protein